MRVQTLHERLLEAGRQAGFAVSFYGQVGTVALPVLRRAGTGSRRLYISSGVHGDEPAGPLAVLQLLRRDLLPRWCAVDIVPLVNPTGLEAGTRTNAQGLDVNRDYGTTDTTIEARQHLRWLGDQRWDLALCLHEDYESACFYLYELKPPEAVSPARRFLEAAAMALPIEVAETIDEMPNDRGIMMPPPANRLRERPDLPEALRLYFHHTPWCYTFESGSQANIVSRVEAQVAAVVAACAWLREGQGAPDGH